MSNFPSPPRHRRGAPPGNSNALKHGFYTGGSNSEPPPRSQETKSPRSESKAARGEAPNVRTSSVVFAPPLVARIMSPHPDTKRRSLHCRGPKRQQTQSPPQGHYRRGAPPGNSNAVKHGFYTRRLKHSHLDGVESTDSSGLIEEIALIRVFTRRLIESLDFDGDPFTLAEILRTLCLASSTISRIVRTQFLLTSTGTSLNDDIDEAIRQINEEFLARRTAAESDPSLLPPSLRPSLPIRSDKNDPAK
jgi:hypothetical protein